MVTIYIRIKDSQLIPLELIFPQIVPSTLTIWRLSHLHCFELKQSRLCFASTSHFPYFNNDLFLHLNMTLHILISTLTQCKNYLLHSSHGRSVSKPPFALHLRLVPQSPFLAIFTLSTHQVTSCFESTLSTHWIPFHLYFFEWDHFICIVVFCLN